MAKLQSPLLEFYRSHRTGVLLTVILLTAVFFRFYQLNHLPPGLHPDEAANGLDIFRMLENHDFRPLYNTNGPRESLFFYLQAIFVIIFGNTILALRIAPAAVGVLAVLATYAWAKSWFDTRVGLIAAFAMAVNPWAVIITRDGFRASMTPLMVPLTLWLLTLAYRKRKLVWFILAGLSIGAGLYTYLAFRAFLLAVVIIGIYASIWRRSTVKGTWPNLLWLGVASLLILVPMILYGIKNPGDVSGRVAGTSFLNPGLNHGQPVQTLLDSTVKTTLMFNIHGDENFRHNLGGQPLLNVFLGIMFVLGILICFSNLNKTRYFGLLAVFGIMLTPAILTAEGIPHALRSVGAIPATMVLAAIGIEYMLERWYSTFPINSAARVTGLSAIVLLLLLSAYQGYKEYFVAWANSPQTYQAYSEDAVAMAQFMINQPWQGERYLILDGYSDKTVQYLTHRKASYTRIDPEQISQLAAGGSKEFIISLRAKDKAIERFKSRFNGGKLAAYESDFNQDQLFFVYKVSK